MSDVRLKFHKAFTLAELMVILAVMTVVIAAVAPVLTSRYNTLMSTEVWHEVNGDDEGDIYTDGNNHISLQEIIIGLSPQGLEDISRNYNPISKLVIRPSDRIENGGDTIVQKPVEFYYGGNKQGYLATGKDNVMLVGEYSGMTIAARGNSSYGYNALNSITTGEGNTAVGSYALSGVESGNFNTAIGKSAGATTKGSGNVYIGYNASANGDYNTIITNNNNSSNAHYTTAIGDNITFGGDYNVALGYSAKAQGGNNTAVGPFAVAPGSNSTAVGYKACSNSASGASNKTCIGQAGASSAAVSGTGTQVLIGRGVSVYNSPSAVVVNSSTTSTDGLGDSSVVIYGNLIVRGQTFMYGKSPFPASSAAFNPPRGDALMGYTFYAEKKHNCTSSYCHKPYYGVDGSGSTAFLTGTSGYLHQVYGGKEHCICTYTGGIYGQGYANPGLESYDWSADYGSPNRFDPYRFGDTSDSFGYYYSGDSGNPNVELSRSHAVYQYGGSASSSCCPVLTQAGVRGAMSSDARLKNIGKKFTSGLDKISKINIFNYTFKADNSKTPQVGVIAQDIKSIFPTAVTKGENGYYQVRWDEMFYTAINSVKELNAKIETFISRIAEDFNRIAKLKKENKKLEDKILKLADEVEKLEQRK